MVNQTCATQAEFFVRLKDFICAQNGVYEDYSTTGIGWTLYDYSTKVGLDAPEVGSWFIIYSPGENGTEDMYYRVYWYSETYIRVQGYLYWNASTSSGSHIYNTVSNFLIYASSDQTLSVYGDLDFIHLWETTSSTYNRWAGFGKLANLMYDDTVATSASALSSGTDVSITVDSVPSSWAVDKKIYIRDNNDFEIITIKTLSGNVITADLDNSYTAGCKMQMDIGYFCNSSTSQFPGNMMVDRVTGTSMELTNWIKTPSTGYADPDQLNGKYAIFPIHQVTVNAYRGSLPNIFYSEDTGLSQGDVLTDPDTGYSYRYLRYYNAYDCMTREV